MLRGVAAIAMGASLLVLSATADAGPYGHSPRISDYLNLRARLAVSQAAKREFVEKMASKGQPTLSLPGNIVLGTGVKMKLQLVSSDHAPYSTLVFRATATYKGQKYEKTFVRHAWDPARDLGPTLWRIIGQSDWKKITPAPNK